MWVQLHASTTSLKTYRVVTGVRSVEKIRNAETIWQLAMKGNCKLCGMMTIRNSLGGCE